MNTPDDDQPQPPEVEAANEDLEAEEVDLDGDPDEPFEDEGGDLEDDEPSVVLSAYSGMGVADRSSYKRAYRRVNLNFTTPEGIFRVTDGGTIHCALTRAVQCGCGRMAMFVINRMGKTRCVDCDAKFQKDPESVKAYVEQELIRRQLAPAADHVEATAPTKPALVGARFGKGWKRGG